MTPGSPSQKYRNRISFKNMLVLKIGGFIVAKICRFSMKILGIEKTKKYNRSDDSYIK